jgi:hypothetical protein
MACVQPWKRYINPIYDNVELLHNHASDHSIVCSEQSYLAPYSTINQSYFDQNGLGRKANT